MSEKQIEALRQWCCAMTYELQRLCIDAGKDVSADSIKEEMEALDELLRKSPDED